MEYGDGQLVEKAGEVVENTGELITDTGEQAVEKTFDYIGIATDFAAAYGLKLIGALLIFVIGKWIAKRVVKLTVKIMRKNRIDETLVSFIESIIYIILMVVIILSALSTVGVETTSFVAILGAAGLAIGLALQGTLGNVGSGVLLISFRPFKVGDFVQVAGELGKVSGISIFATTLLTPDNKVVTIPNASITSGNITNYSAQETRRLDLTFGIGYGDDLKKAKQILQDIVDGDERILRDPEPFVGVRELGDSSVNFAVRPWVKGDDYWDVHFDLHEKVKLTFDEQGISIPFPQRDVHIYQETN